MIKKLILLVILVLVSCTDDDLQNNSTKYNILSFSLSEKNNTDLSYDVLGEIDHNAGTISLKLPFNTDATELIPSIELPEGVSITPAVDISIDFSKSVTFTLEFENQAVKEYVVTAMVDDISMNVNTSGEFLETVFYSPFDSTDDLIEIIKYDNERPIARFLEAYNNDFNSYDEILVEPIYARNIELFEYGANNKISKITEFIYWKLEEGYEFKFENNKVFIFNRTTDNLIEVTNNSSFSRVKTVTYDNEDTVISSSIVDEWGRTIPYYYFFNSSKEMERLEGDIALDYTYFEGYIRTFDSTFSLSGFRTHSGFLNDHPVYGTGSYPPKIGAALNPEYNLFIKYGLAPYGNYIPDRPFIETRGETLDWVEGTERYVNEVNSLTYPIKVTEIKNKIERTVGYSYR